MVSVFANSFLLFSTSAILSKSFVSFQATVLIVGVVDELSSLMKSMPTYTNEFLDIIVQILREYLLSCKEAYKSRCNYFHGWQGKRRTL